MTITTKHLRPGDTVLVWGPRHARHRATTDKPGSYDDVGGATWLTVESHGPSPDPNTSPRVRARHEVRFTDGTSVKAETTAGWIDQQKS